MNRWKKVKQRLLAGALCAVLVFESVNVTALAAQQYEVDASVDANAVFEEDKSTEEASDIVTEPEDRGDEEAPEEEQFEVDADAETSEQTVEEQVEEEDTKSSEVETESFSGTEDLKSDTSKLVIVEGELDGVYQFGGAPSERKSTEDSLKAAAGAKENAAAAEESEIADYLYQEIVKRNTEIDVQSYNISLDTMKMVMRGMLNDHPEFYFVENGFSYSYYGTICYSIKLSYDDTLDDAAFQKGVKAALACVKPDMSDLEKAIVLHDYLAVNCEYDYENYINNTIPSTSYSAYGVLVNCTAVCEGYALAYKYLLNQVGINCYMVTSDEMNHAWNLIELNGKYYQVDVTWDDPTWDIVGRACHEYMFCSDNAFISKENPHEDWSVTDGANVVDYKATDTSYDNAFWTGVTSPLVLIENGCYYVAADRNIKKTNVSNITEAGETICNIGKWNVWGNESSAWQGAYSGLFCVNNRLYYNDKSSIYSISPDGSNKKTEFTADTTAGYIYGSALCNKKVYYALHTDPNFDEKETKLVADITLPFDDSEDESSSSAESESAPESTPPTESGSMPESIPTSESESAPESTSSTESGSMPESIPTTEDESEPESTPPTENGSAPESTPPTESSSAPESEKTEGKPEIQLEGVLFPGKKADGYSVVYTGEKICPAMTVIYTYQDSNGKQKKQTLKQNVDYTVRYSNNVNADENKATVVVTGIGEFSGNVTKTFTIQQKSISKVTLSAVGDIKYGEEPTVTVMDGTKELVEGTDYTVICLEKGNPDTTTVSTLTVEAVKSESCNYTGTANKKVTFNILGSDAENAVLIADARVEWKNPEKAYTYNGKAQKPAVVVTDKDGKKISSSYYKVIYTNNVNAGTATAQVVGVTKKGAGYYGISKPLEFTIKPKSFTKVSVSIKGTIPKFGTISDIQKAINEAVMVKDGKTVLFCGEDYKINCGDIEPFDDIKIGKKYEITISPTGTNKNYTLDTKTLKIKFGQLNLASKTANVSLTITNVDEKKVTLIYNGKTLEQDKDYTVTSIKQDKKTELYTVKIKAVKGSSYKGSRTFKDLQFKALSMTLDKDWITGETGETVWLNAVVPSDVQLSAITWKSSNQSVATVTDEGLVSLVGSGMTVITASANASVEAEQLELTAQCQVVVRGKIEDGEWIDVTEYGAVPGDDKDDWDAIQGALEHSTSHTAYIPAGTYDIDLDIEGHNGIVMRKGYKLYMHKDAVLRAMKTDKGSCQVINVGSSGHQDDPDYYSNIEISGGTIIGDLREAGEDGDGVMGIRVQYAKNIYIHDVTVKECRGDGIYIGGNGKGSTNICVTDCTIEDCSRNCLGIVSAHNLYVDNCKISGAGSLFGGKAPRACILIEKNKGDDTCTDIVIKNSFVDNKAVCDKQSEAYAFGSSSARNEIHGNRLTVENCIFKGKVANYSTTNAKFINCTFEGEKILKQNTVVENK